MVFRHLLRPGKLRQGVVWKTLVFTGLVGLPLVPTLYGLPVVSSLLELTDMRGLLPRLFGYVLVVGVIEETVKLLPVWWFGLRRSVVTDPSTLIYVGILSGLMFGVAESVSYASLIGRADDYGYLGSKDSLVAYMTRLITLPLLHATFAGISSYFVTLASRRRTQARPLLIVGVGTASVLHGAYDALPGLLAVAVAAAAILAFVGYVRDIGDGSLNEAARSAVVGVSQA